LAVLVGVGPGGCGSSATSDDPLDRDRVAEISVAQGSATGSARSGEFGFSLTRESCDCPTVELDGQPVDLCAFASVDALSATLVEASGVLVITTDVPFVAGAIEADGSFEVAAIEDLATLLGPVEALRRMDGQFTASNEQAEGWVGQRLLGQVVDAPIDCRWIGSFIATRN
jgi:hypothetical protein